VSFHIAKINFAEFFRPAFPSIDDATRFINFVENVPADISKAKIVIHQSARLIWLADRIDDVARGRPALLMTFHIVAAEAVAKIVFGFHGEGQSRQHVRRFFQEICPKRHRSRLERAFRRSPAGPFLTLQETVDVLYDVRCDVVHEGQYFTLTLPNSQNDDPILNLHGDESLIASISAQELRQIVLESSLLAACLLLPQDSQCRELLHSL
jgi:hypothetical protein